MDVGRQAKRLIPFIGEEKANANAYLGLAALGGFVGWGFTALIVFEVSAQPRLLGLALVVLALWIAIVIGQLVLGYLSVEDGVQVSTPFLLWGPILVVAFLVTIVGLVLQNTVLVIGPWYAAFAVGYLVSTAFVSRAGIYLLAGLASLLGLIAAVLAPGAAHVLILGALHVVPLAMDAAMGGRQMTDEGVPAVDAERIDEETEEAGGVIT